MGIGLVYPKNAAHHNHLLLLQIKFIHFSLYKVNIECPATLIRQATTINGGAGGERRLFSDLWKYEEAPNKRFHSDRAGRGVY